MYAPSRYIRLNVLVNSLTSFATSKLSRCKSWTLVISTKSFLNISTSISFSNAMSTNSSSAAKALGTCSFQYFLNANFWLEANLLISSQASASVFSSLPAFSNCSLLLARYSVSSSISLLVRELWRVANALFLLTRSF